MSQTPLLAKQKEDDRIAFLHSLKLLDTPAEPVFDRITRLASRLLDVPIALVSLVDIHRQWFKSAVGLEATETPREYAFCSHAIQGTDPMVVSDATKDGRFVDNPLVTGPPYIRFYAGAPIITSNGHALGTVCIIDDQARTMDPEEMQTLIDLAGLASREIQQYEAVLTSHDNLNRSTQVIEQSDARFRTMFDLAAVGIAFVAPNGSWLQVNTALTKILGYSAEEFARLTFQDITHQDDLDKDLDLMRQLVMDDIAQYQLEKRYIRKDGTLVWAELSATKQVMASGEIDYFVAIIEDIQARKDAEESLAVLHRDLERRVIERTSELRDANEMLSFSMAQQLSFEQLLMKREAELAAVLENANDAYVCLDQAGLVTAWNRAAHETFGWSPAEAMGKRLDELIIPPTMREAHRLGMQRYLNTGEAKVLNQRLELPAIRKDGTSLPVEVRIRSININGQEIFSAFLHDIAERKQTEATREREALHDALTGLPNRRALFECLPKALMRSKRNRQALALLFLDLDGFKAVNDAFGHDAGDCLLKHIAQRLTDCVRQTDYVARLSGDEFTVVLENLAEGATDARRIAQKLLMEINKPVVLGANAARVSVSIGIAVYQGVNDNETADQLIQRADTAMYSAKRGGKCCVREF